MTVPSAVRRPIFDFLYSDLFERVPSAEVEGVSERTMVLRSPLGWTVLLSERQDKRGYAGEVRAPDGSRVSTTSWVEVPWLDEKLP